MAGEYDDIINLPYKKSTTRPHMKLIDRAAQFSPFAALTTHSDAIKETGRLTSERIILDEDSIKVLDGRFQMLLENISDNPKVTLTYFVEDKYKSGGEYVEATGKVKKIDGIEPIIYFEDGTRITMMDVINISGEIFK
ncbi:MAG: hypothetical protein ACRC2K_12570 [Clostridium sp.]